DPRGLDARPGRGRHARTARRAGLGRPARWPHEPPRRPRGSPPPEDRSGSSALAHPHGPGIRLPRGPSGGTMTLSFKTRLALWHMAVVALILGGAAAGAHWALSRAVLGTIIDDALLSLAESEAAALLADPTAAPRVHEMPPGTASPSFVRLDKFLQIVEVDGTVPAREPTPGTGR